MFKSSTVQSFKHLEPFKPLEPLELCVAQMAKLVDALPSGGSVRKDVLVRIQSRAPLKPGTLVSNSIDKGFVFWG